MYIVSGCPRSGTSLMMNIMRASLGDERLLGYKSPNAVKTQRQRDAALEEAQRNDAPEIVKYVRKKRTTPTKQEARRRRRAEKMNPDGFWEMAFTVQGVYYRPEFEKLLDVLLTEETKTFCKIVSQGLAKSDPRFIDKIVYMARDPRSVAKSQEQLGRPNSPMGPENAPKKDGVDQLIRSVGMYNQVTVAAAKWMINHPDVPVHIVNYDRLIDSPADTLADVQAFLGEGDFTKGAELIKPSLRRSEPTEEGVTDNLKLAMDLHERLLLKDWQGILDIAEDERKKPKMPASLWCVRIGSVVNRGICNVCRDQEHVPTIENFIQSANERCIDWRNEPCVYECRPFREGVDVVSLEGSIANNHWKAIGGQGCKFAEVTKEQAIHNQPCAGKKIICLNPECPVDRIPAKNCNRFKCLFYVEEENDVK